MTPSEKESPRVSYRSKSLVRAGSTRGNHAGPAPEPLGPLELSHCRLIQGHLLAQMVIFSGMRRIQLSEGKKVLSAPVSGWNCFYWVCLTTR